MSPSLSSFERHSRVRRRFVSHTYVAIPPERALEERVPGFREAAAVFVSGSLVAGFGHANSDVDVYVCFASAEDRADALAAAQTTAEPDSGTPMSVFYADDVRWDVEYHLAEEIEALLGMIERPSEPSQVILSDSEIDLLYRISVAKRISGTELLESWQQRIEESKLRDILSSRYFAVVDAAVEDALGLLEVGDVSTAAYCARNAFEQGTAAVLASTGRYCPSAKWRIAQLRKSPAGSITAEEYLDIVEMRGFDGPEWVERVVDRTRDLAFEI
jgi:hypothetical protein